MDEIINLIVNNGVGVACLVYFMIRDYKFVEKINNTLAVVESYIALREKKLKGDDDKDD